MDNAPTTTAKRRWRPRFSLRTLLLCTLLVGSGTTLWWHWEPWNELNTLELGDLVTQSTEPSGSVPCAYLAANDSRVVTKNWDGVVQVWDATNGQLIGQRKWDSNPWRSVTISPDGEMVTSVGWSNGQPSAYLWDLHGNIDINLEPAPIGTKNVFSGQPRFSQDGRGLLFAVGHSLRVYDIEHRAKVCELIGHTAPINDAATSHDGKLIATASADHTVRIWNSTTGIQLGVLKGHTEEVTECFFAPDDKTLLTTSLDSSSRLWNLNTNTEIAKMKGGLESRTGQRFSAGGQYICTGGNNVWIWSSITGKELHEIKALLPTIAVISPVLSPDSTRFLCFGTDGQIRMFDTETGACIGNLEKAPGSRYQGVHCFEGAIVGTAGYGNAARLSGIRDGILMATLQHNEPISSIMIAKSCERCVTATVDNRGHIWSRRRPEPLWGLAWLPEFWLTLVFSAAFAWSAWRDRGETRRLPRMTL